MTTKSSKKAIVIVVIAAVLLSIIALLLAHQVWFSKQQKFHDVTVELGTETLGISQFMTKYALAHRVGFVSDVSAINLGKVGTTELVLSHGSKIENVTLTVEDTTPPVATFADKQIKFSDYVPDAKDFVVEAFDLSNMEYYFAEEPVVNSEYEDISVEVVVEDAYGNKTTGTCILGYVWIPETYALEYGNTLTKEDLLYNAEKDSHLVNQEDLDAINAGGLGTYTIVSSTATRTLECVVTVQDTLGPELEVKDVPVYLYGYANLNHFLVSVNDASGVKDVRLMTELRFDTISEQKVIIEAEDIYGNITRKEATLFVTTDLTPPAIDGLTNMTVPKHSDPDFLTGVSAYDYIDGECAVEVDTEKLNLSKAGTYYITYTAKDKSGNVATARRKVTVEHDQEDTKALVQSIAAMQSDNPEILRDYIRYSINYSSNWGEPDPVWHGFTTRSGNCYVHALCLKALLDEKGFTNKLIWVADKSHYWLQIYIDGRWWHIDPTPGDSHSRYSLMNDAQRYETLYHPDYGYRDWDRSQWPACP